MTEAVATQPHKNISVNDEPRLVNIETTLFYQN